MLVNFADHRIGSKYRMQNDIRKWIVLCEAENSLRAEVLALAKKLPQRYQHADGTTVWLTSDFLQRVEAADEAELPKLKADFESTLAHLKANPKAKLPDYRKQRMPRARLATLKTLKARTAKAFLAWLKADYSPDELKELMADPESEADVLADFLHEKYSLDVRADGLITFWLLRVEGVNLRTIIGDLPIALYHFTSSKQVRSIRTHGLQGDREAVNGRKEDGVYLTTETDGAAVSGYKRRATAVFGGYPVLLVVKCYLSELRADQDDADLTSGQYQFVMDHVPPERIVKVERAGW